MPTSISQKYKAAKHRVSELLQHNSEGIIAFIAIAAAITFMIAIIAGKSGIVNFITFWILGIIWIAAIASALFAFATSWKGFKFSLNDQNIGILVFAGVITVIGAIYLGRSDVWSLRDRVQIALEAESISIQQQLYALAKLRTMKSTESSNATAGLKYSASINSWVIPLTLHPFPGASGLLPSRSKSKFLKIAISPTSDSGQILIAFDASRSISDSTYDDLPSKCPPSTLMFGEIEKRADNNVLWLYLPSRISPATIYINPNIINRQFKDERSVPAEKFSLPPISASDMDIMTSHIDKRKAVIDSCKQDLHAISETLSDKLTLRAFVERVEAKNKLKGIRKFVSRKF